MLLKFCCAVLCSADPELCSVSSSFGCLFYDNYQDRLYYASKPITCDVNTFQQNMSQYSSVYTFQPQLPTVPLLNSNYTVRLRVRLSIAVDCPAYAYAYALCVQTFWNAVSEVRALLRVLM